MFTKAHLRSAASVCLSANNCHAQEPSSALGYCSHPKAKTNNSPGPRRVSVTPPRFLRALITQNRWQAALTSARVHLQLPVDVGLVYQGVKDIEDTVNIPDFGIGTKEVNLLFRLLGSLTAVLTK